MSYDIYLSYSGRASYLLCPKKYWFGYLCEEKLPRDPRNTLFGTVQGKVFEWFYVRAAWAEPDPVKTTMSFVEPAMKWTFEHEKWDPDQDPALVANIREGVTDLVPSTIDVIRTNRLISPATRCEYNLQLDCSHEGYDFLVRLGGKADFLHVFPTGNWIIDGKASSYREKYVDIEQVIWYGVQHYLKFHVAPARLGFLYYRFPKDPLQWVDFTEESIRNSLKTTFETAKKIRLNMFDPTPSFECKRCDFRPRCPEGQKFLTDRSVDQERSRIVDSAFEFDRV